MQKCVGFIIKDVTPTKTFKVGSTQYCRFCCEKAESVYKNNETFYACDCPGVKAHQAVKELIKETDEEIEALKTKRGDLYRKVEQLAHVNSDRIVEMLAEHEIEQARVKHEMEIESIKAKYVRRGV